MSVIYGTSSPLTLAPDETYTVGLDVPTGVSATTHTGGGSLDAGTYYYVIVGRTADGTTLQSDQVSAVVAPATPSTIWLAWSINAPSGITSFDIYRSSTSGVYGPTSFLQNVTATNAYATAQGIGFPPYEYVSIDTGGTALTPGSPPTVITAFAANIGVESDINGLLLNPIIHEIPGFLDIPVTTMLESGGFNSPLRASAFIEPNTELVAQGDIPIFWAGKDTQGVAGTVGGYPVGLVWQALGYGVNQFAFVDSEANPQNLGVYNLNASTLNISSGVANNGGGIKHQRITTGSINATSSALVTVTWTTAFPDTNYTVTCSVQDATAAALSLVVVHIETLSASAVAVRVANTSAGALTGTLHIMAIHDYTP